MSGTKAGALIARETNKRKYGEDYYRVIGAKGGRNGTTGGFYYSMVNGYNWHKVAGRKGGLISKRRKA